MGALIMAKLTLNVDREVIEKAKRLAAERQTSVSALFSQFIRALGDSHDLDWPVGRLARRASGVIELPKGKSHRDVLGDALRDGYGL
jgi:hypothetical protein